METLILGWYVLVETGSVLLLTLFGALQFAGTLVAPLFGVAGDRIGHRNLLCIMRTAYATLAILLMSLAFAGALEPHARVRHCRPERSGPAFRPRRAHRTGRRQRRRDQLVAAMGISRTTSDSRPGRRRAGRRRHVRGVRHGSGLRRGRRASMRLACCSPWPSRHRARRTQAMGRTPACSGGRPGAISAKASPTCGRSRSCSPPCGRLPGQHDGLSASNGLLPYVAKNIYGIDQTGLGYLVASFAFGALLGSVALSWRGSGRPARLMIVRRSAGTQCCSLFAHMPGPDGAAHHAGARRLHAEPVHGAAGRPCCCATRASIPRPRHGCAHARHLQPAARLACWPPAR